MWQGYKYHFPEKNLVTVWSAPNYCYRCGEQCIVSLTTYIHTAHTYIHSIVQYVSGVNDSVCMCIVLLDALGNVASVLSFDDYLNRDFKIFKDVPEPEETQKRNLVPYFL